MRRPPRRWLRQPRASSVPYTTEWYNQTLDHFNFQTAAFFMQRYLVDGLPSAIASLIT